MSSNNTVSNNTASVSNGADYFCGAGNSNMSAEAGGINYGAAKVGCKWMALIQHVSSTPPCTASISPDVFTLTYDYVYPYGSTCFTMLSNSSTINCNGHTIISTNGGVFAKFAKGTHGSIIEGCYLKGFTTAIEAINGSATIYNNTILQSGKSTGILAVGFLGGSIRNNNVTGGGVSFAIYNGSNVNVQGNSAYLSTTGYYVYNTLSATMSSDYADHSTSYGLVLNGTTVGQFRSLMLNSGSVGLQCIGSSKKSSTLFDQGGNVCSSQLNCSWLSSSSGSC